MPDVVIQPRSTRLVVVPDSQTAAVAGPDAAVEVAPRTEAELSVAPRSDPDLILQPISGPPGPPGPPGPSGASYVHQQAMADNVWTIPHGLGLYPAGIVVVDSSGSDVEGDVSYPDINTVTLTFTYPFAGTAYLS